MKSCELCKQRARIHCASDQANLCWGCDARVHSANFLVARHTRGLLCNVCQDPTPWSASGSKLGPTAFVCEKCIERGAGSGSSGDDSPSSAEEAEEVEEANQVVPWSPPTDHSSSSDEEAVVSGKRCCTGVSSGNSGSNEDEISSSSLNTFVHPTPAARAMGCENADAEEVYFCSR